MRRSWGKYLCDTRDLGIMLKSQKTMTVEPYVDSEYANDRVDRKSVTGYVTCINGAPIMWKTKKQSIVTLSSTEAEYVGMTMMM